MVFVPGKAKRGNELERGKTRLIRDMPQGKGRRAATRRATRTNPEPHAEQPAVRLHEPGAAAQRPGMWRAASVSRACAGRMPTRSNTEHRAQQAAMSPTCPAMNLPQPEDALRVPGRTDAASRSAVRFDPEQRCASTQRVRFHPHENGDCAGDVIFPPKEKLRLLISRCEGTQLFMAMRFLFGWLTRP